MILRVLILSLLLPSGALAAECKGEDPCKACKDCSRCRYCDPKNPKGGSCGTIRAQDGDAARKRQAKQAR